MFTFSRIFIGADTNYKEHLDEYPIYVFDFESDSGIFDCQGNFKTYMKGVLSHCDKNDKVVQQAINDLLQFSDNTIHKGRYKLLKVTN